MVNRSLFQFRRRGLFRFVHDLRAARRQGQSWACSWLLARYPNDEDWETLAEQDAPGSWSR